MAADASFFQTIEEAGAASEPYIENSAWTLAQVVEKVSDMAFDLVAMGVGSIEACSPHLRH